MTGVPRPEAGAADRVAAVIGEVVRTAVAESRTTGVVIMDDGSPEAELCAAWCAAALGDDAVHRVAPPAEHAVLQHLEVAGMTVTGSGQQRDEAHRFHLRVAALARNALGVHPVNKTALLLGDAIPPEPLLPLGDLHASRVRAVTGEWSAPAHVKRMAEQAGGIEALDRALVALLEERRPADTALSGLPSAVRHSVLRALNTGRFARRRFGGVIPKLTARTAGIDLFS